MVCDTNISTPYEEIECVVFDGTKVFDTMLYGNNLTSIYIKFKRTNVTNPIYLFGCDGLECFWDRATKSFVEPVQNLTTYSYAQNIEDEEYEDE